MLRNCLVGYLVNVNDDDKLGESMLLFDAPKHTQPKQRISIFSQSSFYQVMNDIVITLFTFSSSKRTSNDHDQERLNKKVGRVYMSDGLSLFLGTLIVQLDNSL